MTHADVTHWSGARRAFTLIELLVVVSIIVVGSVLLLPAFGRLVKSNNYASAINSVTATLGKARALAIGTGRPTAVAFLYDSKEERMSLQVLVLSGVNSGVLTDQSTSSLSDQTYCHVFIPAPFETPIVLPKRIGVFGYVPTTPKGFAKNSARTPLKDVQFEPGPTRLPYAGEWVETGNVSVLDPTDNIIDLWLFPRNDPRMLSPQAARGFYGVDPWDRLTGLDQISGYSDTTISDAQAIAAVRNVSTFFVQFSAEGSVVLSTRTGGTDSVYAYLEYPDDPRDTQNPSAKAYDDPARFDPENFGGLSADRRSANRETMLLSAAQLAVVDLSVMNEELGYPQPWLSRASLTRAPKPDFLVNATPSYVNDVRVRELSRWIDLHAEIVSFSRYTGNVIRRSPR
jgi:prepilin-type N-terminal cleavage/methylation domain-containing protein